MKKVFSFLALAVAAIGALAQSIGEKINDGLFSYAVRSGAILCGVPRASGVPEYGPGGTVNYNPEVYSGKLVEKFYRTTVFGEIASTDYEGEISGFGANVIIRTVPDVTVSDYIIGAGLTPQYPTRNSVTLSIDKAKSFNVALSTVDSRQSDIDMADVFANDGSMQLRIAVDADMLETIPADVSGDNSGTTAGAISADIDLGSAAAPRVLSSDDVVELFTDMGQVLDEQNVSPEGRWAVVPAWLTNLIKNSDLKIASLAGDGVSILRNGKVGEINAFTLYMSNNVLRQVSPAVCSYVPFGHSAGLTFAAQIIECQMIDNPNDFGYLIRGLMVYGYEVIEPSYVGTAIVVKAPAT